LSSKAGTREKGFGTMSRIDIKAQSVGYSSKTNAEKYFESRARCQAVQFCSTGGHYLGFAIAMILVSFIGGCVAAPRIGGQLSPTSASSSVMYQDSNEANNELVKYVKKAGMNCRPSVVQNFITHGADPNAEYYGEPALTTAAGNGATRCALSLLRNGAIPTRRDWGGISALFAAAGAPQCDASLVDALVAHGADPNVREGILGTSVLAAAAGQQNFACVQALLRMGSRVNAESKRRHLTALYTGLWPKTFNPREREKMTRLLLSKGANPNARGPHGTTALFVAVGLAKGINPCPACAKLLLATGANPNIFDDAGETPLLWGLRPKLGTTLNAVKALIEGGANVNLANPKTGETPLMAASAKGDEAIINYLLRVGAKRCAQDKQGRTAADYARTHHLQLVKNLLCFVRK